jgi:Putative peptidoglycan binding domain
LRSLWEPDVIYYVGRFLSKRFMSPNPFRCFLVVSLIALSVACVRASDDPLFHSSDPLAPRDEWGVFHQTPNLYPTDFAHRYNCRFSYYLMSRRELLADPAYVSALQICLRNQGYYCGPIDGINSEQVSEAIARLQKNFAQRVTGHLTVPVRRALHLP